MFSDVVLSVGQALEVQDALRRQGRSLEDLKKITSGSWLSKLMKVIDGRAEIKDIEYLIDCAAHSSAPNDWSVHPKDQIASRVCGLLAWNLGIASLWLSEKQKNGKFVTGNELRKELEGQPVLNANVLDFLLEHTHLISEEWKGRRVFFWGTIYFDLKSNRYVRYLYWAGGKWRWHYFFLGRNWDVDDIAVVRAS